MTNHISGVKGTRDGGLIVHPSVSVATDSIQSPLDDTQGAGFGDTITDTDREFAATREPVCHFLIYGVASDITEKGFSINDPDTEEADPALDRMVQDALSPLKFKRQFTKAIAIARRDSWSLMVGGFNDAKTPDALRKPLTFGSELKQLVVYSKTKVQVETKDENLMSPRYGEAIIYKLDRGNGNYLYVHYTRCNKFECNDEGTSVLDAVWDDVTCGRNIRWGAAQWMYRYGGGFPVLEFPAGTTVEQLETFGASGAFDDLMSRTYILTAQNSTQENNGMKFSFAGAAGATLDPSPFFQTNIEQISVATGIPQAKLVGAQAGAVTGSEVNMQDYYKVISREQARYEDNVRWVIDRLAESGQISLVASSTATDKAKALFKKVFGDYRHKTAKTYNVEWTSAFELSEKDEAQIEFTHAQTLEKKLGWCSKDEVRAEEGLEPLPNGAGEWKDQSEFGFGEETFEVKTKQKMGKANAKPTEETANSSGKGNAGSD